jgi:hypothetical protein
MNLGCHVSKVIVEMGLGTRMTIFKYIVCDSDLKQMSPTTGLVPETSVKALRHSSRQARAPSKVQAIYLKKVILVPKPTQTLTVLAWYPRIHVELASACQASNHDPDVLKYDQIVACEY